MKKKRDAKKTSKTKVSKKYEHFSNKRFLAITIIAFFVFAFLLSFVNVQKVSITGYQPAIVPGQGEKVRGFVKDMFASWGGGQLDVNVAKYILWFTILAFIMGLFAFLGFPKTAFLRFLISLGISFLTIAYLTPGEIFTVLVSYSVLGLTLGVFFPFLAINLASAMLLSADKISELNVGRLMSVFVLWILWTSFLGYRIIKIWVEEPAAFFSEGRVVLIIVFIISALITILNKYYRKGIFLLGEEVFRRKRERERVAVEEFQKTTGAIARASEEEGRKGFFLR